VNLCSKRESTFVNVGKYLWFGGDEKFSGVDMFTIKTHRKRQRGEILHGGKRAGNARTKEKGRAGQRNDATVPAAWVGKEKSFEEGRYMAP